MWGHPSRVGVVAVCSLVPRTGSSNVMRPTNEASKHASVSFVEVALGVEGGAARPSTQCKTASFFAGVLPRLRAALTSLTAQLRKGSKLQKKRLNFSMAIPPIKPAVLNAKAQAVAEVQADETRMEPCATNARFVARKTQSRATVAASVFCFVINSLVRVAAAMTPDVDQSQMLTSFLQGLSPVSTTQAGETCLLTKEGRDQILHELLTLRTTSGVLSPNSMNLNDATAEDDGHDEIDASNCDGSSAGCLIEARGMTSESMKNYKNQDAFPYFERKSRVGMEEQTAHAAVAAWADDEMPHANRQLTDGGCPATCFGATCDQWYSYDGSTCAVSETIYGCNCDGCECAGDAGASTNAPTATAAPTTQSTLPLYLSVSGSCDIDGSDTINDIFAPVDTTLDGRWYYKGETHGVVLYFDAGCSGLAGTARWIFDVTGTIVSTTAASDLDGDGSCVYMGRINYDGMNPPLGPHTWTIYCGALIDVELTIVRVGRPSATPTHSPTASSPPSTTAVPAPMPSVLPSTAPTMTSSPTRTPVWVNALTFSQLQSAIAQTAASGAKLIVALLADITATETLNIDNNEVEINSQNGAVLSGSGSSRLFVIGPTGKLSGRNITLRDGHSANDGGAVYIDYGSLDLEGCTLKANSASDDGGALDNKYGTATLRDCTLTLNSAGGTGGAVHTYDGTLELNSCALTANAANTGSGGAVCSDTHTRLSNCHARLEQCQLGWGGL